MSLGSEVGLGGSSSFQPLGQHGSPDGSARLFAFPPPPPAPPGSYPFPALGSRNWNFQHQS